MNGGMQGFTKDKKNMPEKRAPEERREDFGEIYEQFVPEEAAVQSSRCAQCGVPFCPVNCPLGNNIPDWLRLVAEGRLEEAWEMASATNTFPEICGRICPQDRLCEKSCVIEQSGHGGVSIGALEKYIADTAFANGWVKPRKPAKEKLQSVGVIGSGPAGLAAAELLRFYGYKVTVYDRHDRAGGLLIYGIPGFKLDKNVIDRRIALMKEQGVEFRLNYDVKNLEEVRNKHDAVLLATGVYRARDLKIPGAGLDGVVQALDYLIASNKKELGDEVPEFDSGELNASGRNVVVIGGGDTAMDCLRTAVRQGAKSVKCLYRRDRANMPGSFREVQNAEEEGVEFMWLSSPVEIMGQAPHPAKGVKVRRMELGEPDSSGRRRPVEVKGSDFVLPAGLVIKALGFEPEDPEEALACEKIKTTPWGTMICDYHSKMTNMEGVFAAGDNVRGASLVVWAIKEGRDAAESIRHYLEGKGAG
jgi:glutamate synthase (NADPH/NADH) small chain